ncbi:hypothetical protein ATDW_36510 (plasmid) [Asticcacaulis sp. DW145]|uniref:hypothetical protein n=1 Tax=Asticcacaulis sp. DW145 TaxID=3095608 RepID=UPI0030847C5E|nr:hypothetical protein ATDW_36510 [Asticcacaulis sp. DW145]
MKRVDMVREGAEQLIVAENAVEQALIEVTDLANRLSRMRLKSNLAMGVGRDAMTSVLASIEGLSKVRNEMIDAHAHLNAVKTQIGCRTVAVGHLEKPEGDGKSSTTGLHVVGEKRSA